MATTTLTPTSARAETPKLMKPGSAAEAKSPTAAPMQTTFGCQHIKSLLTVARQKATDGYTRLIQSLRKEEGWSDRTHMSGGGAKTTTSTTYLCLQCPTVSSTRERHRKDHVFAVESDHGFIYCHDCRDFVYDPTFETLRTTTTSSHHAPLKKRKLSSSAALAPLTSEDRKLVRANTATTPCAATGLRGMYNMGQTCFMSVILQSLLHNPLIRAWYLSEGHRSSDCEREACTACALDEMFAEIYAQDKREGYGAVHMLQGCWKGGGGLAGYSQQDAHEYLGFILNSLHTAITEHDAAEEEGEGETVKKKKEKDVKDSSCDCVVHQTFSGQLRSTVTCGACHNITTSLDPFMDLSLDIRSTAVVTKKKKLSMINGTTTIQEVLPMELTECLDRFTSPETLSSDSYYCRRCGGNREARKQLGLSRLPPILPIHLKRFSHSKGLGVSSKVETRIRVPFVLDFGGYLSGNDPPGKEGCGKVAGKGGAGGTSTGRRKVEVEIDVDADADSADGDADADADGEAGDPADDGDDDGHEGDIAPSSPVYDLASVIVHKGKIDNGHYISYCRQAHAAGITPLGSGSGSGGGGEGLEGDGAGKGSRGLDAVGGEEGGDWFRFDDSMVVQVSEREVLGAEAYMVFYVARGWVV
ncbi:hypothetical protein B0A55_12162 [Friedmanniomyces simplex]|uniref:Ubiquitin carboxyl-terminal hydrolase n=1 Tax=Friedmanniomyces simplex TaxID=329884 RepID=A0A4U0WIC0_9PEZI|nr:hypothetical protein B0A55_12162 [Friedmanniomyces simplex]